MDAFKNEAPACCNFAVTIMPAATMAVMISIAASDSRKCCRLSRDMPSHMRTTAFAHVRPAPIAMNTATSPFFSFPPRTASSSAIGMLAAEVLP